MHSLKCLFQNILVFSVILIFSGIPASAQWTRKTDGLRIRGECLSVIYGNKVFSFGGFHPRPYVDTTNEVYNVDTDTWSFIAPFPIGKQVTHSGMVLVDDEVWIIGGRVATTSGPATDEVLIYNITNNKFRMGPSLKDAATGKAIHWAAGNAVLLAGKIHVFGGLVETFCNGDQDQFHLTIDVEKYKADPNTTWANDEPPMPLKRVHLDATVLNGKIYAIGGQNDHDCGSAAEVSYVQSYNPLSQTWTRLNDLIAPRSHSEGATFAMDGKIYVFGGQGADGYGTTTILQLDPLADNGMGSWSVYPLALPKQILGTNAKFYNNQFILAHGATVRTTDVNETYIAPLKRTTPFQLGFLENCFSKVLSPNAATSITNILYSIEGSAQFNVTSNAPWLTITKNASGTVNKSGLEVNASINTSGLADGDYHALVSVSSTGTTNVTGASFCVNITVSSAQPRINVSISGSGVVAKSPNKTNYLPGEAVILTATPATGQQFLKWSGDTTTSVNPFEITIGTHDVNLTANFVSNLVENISATSGRDYNFLPTNTGALGYSDRTYDLTSVPTVISNSFFIQPANDDKTNTSSNLLSFDLKRAADIFIAYDPRATSLPSWMSGFVKIADVLGINDSKISGLQLYKKSFASGRITFGGNLQSPASGALTNYIVVLKETTSSASYGVNVTSSNGGTVSKDPNQATYIAGSSVKLTAVPQTGYKFSDWGGDASGNENPLTITVNSNKNISATFTQVVNYTLSVNITGSGSVVKSPDQASYAQGTLVSLTATPISGYQFTGWSGDITGVANPISVTMSGDRTINANFSSISGSPLISNIQASSGRNYSLSTLSVGVQEYTDRTYTVTSVPDHINNQALIRTPNDDKSNTSSNLLSFELGEAATVLIAFDPRASTLPSWLSGWVKLNDKIGVTDKVKNMDLYSKSYSTGTVSLGGTMAAPSSGAMTNYFVVVKPSGTLSNFALATTVNGNGTVIRNPDQPSYASGSNVSLTAQATNGYTFTGWSGDASGTTNPLKVIMDADKNIVANFSPAQSNYSITIDINGNGSVSRSPNQISYVEGSEVILTATAENGYAFKSWSGSVSGTSNPITVTVNSNLNITATFEAVTTSFISEVQVSSGKGYQIGKLNVGSICYVDRNYTVTSAPQQYLESDYIALANNDKREKSANYLSFTLSTAADVVVAYDPRAKTLPGWLDGWSKLTPVLGINDPKISSLDLFMKHFEAGKIVLGGNLADPASGALNNYLVFMQPVASGNLTTSRSTNGADLVEEMSHTLSAFPNPVSSKLTVSFSTMQDGNYHLRITDITGRVLSNRAIRRLPEITTIYLDMKGFSPGIYLISLERNGRVLQTLKVSKL